MVSLCLSSFLRLEATGLGDSMGATLLWARHVLWMLVLAFFVAPPAQVAALCLPNQSSALLEFKQGLALLQSDALGSWTNGSDCCSWSGVTCNSSTGFVIFLQLSGVTASSPSARTRPNPSNFSDALFDLRHLRFLDLSYNQFYGSIPFRLVELRELADLNLNNAGFSGQVPSQIFRLPYLQHLDISNNPNLQGPFPEMLPANSSLLALILSSTNLSGTIPESIGNLIDLRLLKMSSCNFTGSIPSSFSKLTRLQIIDMSFNGFTGPLPSLSASTVTEIDLSVNRLLGPIPESFGELHGLTALKLDNNLLTGPIPSALLNLPSLKTVDLSNNNLTGSISQFTNASSLLETLDLSNNSLIGEIPSSITSLSQLKVIELSFNNFSGTVNISLFVGMKNLSKLGLSENRLTVADGPPRPRDEVAQLTTLQLSSCNIQKFPESLRYQTSLTILDLGNNNITGSIPSWLWGMLNLQHLNLSHNMLTGLEKPMDIGNRTSLLMLDLHSNFLGPDLPPFPPNAIFLDFSSNKFTSFMPSSINSTSLLYLSISNNSIKDTIPESLCKSAILIVLDLSNNSLVGSIPYCLTNSSELSILNLRENQLTGTIPDGFNVSCSLRTLNLRGNRLTGRLPASLCNCSALEVLDLSNNNLTGGFPTQLGCLNNLRVLALRSNKLNGPVVAPASNEKAFPVLQIIDISCNNFSGTLDPRFFELLTGMMKKSGNGTAKLLGFRFLSNIYYQDTVEATIKGVDFQMTKIMNILTSIDLSNNHFSGEIPEEIGKLSGLFSLNMSKNSINGPIPNSMGNLLQLESLDLSKNGLSGNIPQELANLTFLSVLNLSFNDLQGKIPEARQFSTFSADSFMGNPGLCGMQLDISCTHSGEYGDRNHDSLNGKTAVDPLIYIAAEVGFIAGLAAILILLFRVVKVRKWWCGLVDRFAEVLLKKLHSD